MKQNRALITLLSIAVTAGLALAQDPPASPPKTTTVTIGGKNITIKYSAPSVKGRKIFGATDALVPDNTIWRAGANNATSLHTDMDINVDKLLVRGDYTLYVYTSPKAWQLVVSTQTGQWGINRDGSTTLDAKKALIRVLMKMSTPPAPVEQYKMTLAPAGGKKATLTLEWENKKASVDITAL